MRNSGVLARIFTRSMNASRVKRMCSGAGFKRAASANNGFKKGHIAALSRSGGSPVPKWLSASVQSMRLNQSPLS